MSGATTVVAIEFIITATLVYPVNGGPRQLNIYRSAIVRPDDAEYKPVAEILDNHCSMLSGQATIDDGSMMFGTAVQETYKVWQTCPGPEVQHDCTRSSVEVPEALAS